jgi:hypothetical protein
MNTSGDAVFNNRMGEIRGMRAAAPTPPTSAQRTMEV